MRDACSRAPAGLQQIASEEVADKEERSLVSERKKPSEEQRDSRAAGSNDG